MVQLDRQGLKVEVPEVHLFSDRRARVSRWFLGNPKLWPPNEPGCYTYDRIAGREFGTCPDSTDECETWCYAKRISDPHLLLVMKRNGEQDLPELPEDAKVVRIHVSGDFDTSRYIRNWIEMVMFHPDVQFFGYTRAWRSEHLRRWVDTLRIQPNVQLFASVDYSMSDAEIKEVAGAGWRLSWIDKDDRLLETKSEFIKEPVTGVARKVYGYVCPEETGRKPNCLACGYCIWGKKGDVVFPLHGG